MNTCTLKQNVNNWWFFWWINLYCSIYWLLEYIYSSNTPIGNKLKKNINWHSFTAKYTTHWMLIRHCSEWHSWYNVICFLAMLMLRPDMSVLIMTFECFIWLLDRCLFCLVLLLTSSDQILTNVSLFVSRINDINSTENVRKNHANNYFKGTVEENQKHANIYICR